jgi:hypothetical protein
MLTTIEDLADKLETLNENTRELLYKLYLWDTVEDVETIPVTLRVPNAPFFQTFRIPTKKHAVDYISQQNSSLKTSKVTKNWGKYSSNSDLKTTIDMIKGVSADVNFVYYDGPDVSGATKFQLLDATESDVFEFIVTISTSFNPSDNELVKFLDASGTEICGLKNTPISSVYDTPTPIQNRLPITYKLSFRYVPDINLVNNWKLFDFYAMPSFKYDGVSSFKYNSPFVDPTT